MMRKSITILIVLFAVTIAYVAKSQEHMEYSVLAIEYIGASDKPVTPIVISDSRAGAEWFRTTVLKRGDLDLTSINVVSASQMKSLISDAERHRGIFQQEQQKVQKSAETISVTIVKSQDRSGFLLSAGAAVSMLDSLKALCKDDEPLQSNLSHFQKRILP
jgi:hypothetical protein